MLRKLFLFLSLIGGLCVQAQETIDISGAWDLSLGDSTKYNDYVMLPGSLQTNGKGDRVTVNTRWTASLYDSSYYFNPYMAKYRTEDNLKFPFFLTPETHYVGQAWYKKSVYVPDSWNKKRVVLYLERPHIETTLFVNGVKVGHQLSLSTPHEYDITSCISFGQRNTIVVCVYNGIENVGVGQDSHSVTDQTQGNWNGITGKIELRSQPERLYLKSVKVRGIAEYGVLHFDIELGGTISNTFVVPRTVQVFVKREGDNSPPEAYDFDTDEHKFQMSVTLAENAALWDEFHPNLYRVAVSFDNDYYETVTGLRKISANGRKLFINGRPLFLRGTVENCCFPETGYPPTDEEAWTRIFKKCKEYGLNHMRFHSYCPPEAAFVAADKLGFYLQPEGPSWPNHGVKLLKGQKVDQYLMEESKRILDTYGHHPSFVMMAAGNEPAGDWVTYCNNWVKEMKRYDNTKLYCGASVGGGWAWDSGSDYHVKGGARGLDWVDHAPHSDDDYYSQIEFPRNYQDTVPNNSPIIAHEQGQWCAFPDLKEISQYTGVYKARNFEIFRDLLAENGMASQAEKFLMASGKLQALCYKYEIERNLRTKDYAGFQLLALNDYSGQGTALEGVLNVHWRDKGYTTPLDWMQACGPLVVQARFPKFVYASSDTLVVPIEAVNAMYGAVQNMRSSYYVSSDSDKVVGGGRLFVGSLPVGKNLSLGTVIFPLDSITTAQKLTLNVTFGNTLWNQWDFWVYPNQVDASRDSTDLSVSHGPVPMIHIADSLDAKSLDVLRKGGKVLLTAAGKVRLGRDVVQHYLPVFWNTSWFKMRPPHTTGAYIDKQHPLFKYDFPTDDWSNLNWWELLNKAQVMNLMAFPKDYQPPIQPIDTWHVSRKLGMLVEANVLKGKLLMTTMDITSDLDHRLVARQMRQAILRYMESDDFQPTITLQPQVITDLFTKDAPRVDMFTKDSPDELKPKLQ